MQISVDSAAFAVGRNAMRCAGPKEIPFVSASSLVLMSRSCSFLRLVRAMSYDGRCEQNCRLQSRPTPYTRARQRRSIRGRTADRANEKQLNRRLRRIERMDESADFVCAVPNTRGARRLCVHRSPSATHFNFLIIRTLLRRRFITL